MWIEYNPNPAGRHVGDCSVRAISKALDVDWETAYNMICDAGFDMCDMPSNDAVWGAVLIVPETDRRIGTNVDRFEYLGLYIQGTLL